MKVNILNCGSKFELIFKAVVAVYYLISFTYFFLLASEGTGDEALFIKDLRFIESDGWIAAIEKGISIPYMILAYPFSTFLYDFIALRLVNLILLCSLLYYFFKIVNIRINIFYYYLGFFLATTGAFTLGTNDALFFVGLIIFLTEVFYFIEGRKISNPTVAFSALIISIFTRELIIIYIPLLILGIFYLYKNGFVLRFKNLLLPITLVIVLLLMNLPILNAHGKLSYDSKLPPDGINATWSQRQYLAQLLVNEGKIKNLSHPTWEETERYLEKNGKNSLPNGILQGLTFDYSITIVEFFKDLFYSTVYGFRQLGLMIIFPIYFIVFNFRRKHLFSNELFVPYSSVLMIGIFSLIIISYVELRWMTAVFILLITFYSHYQKEKKIDLKIILLNYFILICLSLYGILGLTGKLLSEFI